jgi:CO/xanthine dehydrogenase Mo-binding subunit
VVVQHVQGSGCYGHNAADDAPADAALLAMAVPGRAVKLQWSREDEHRWEPYGSAGVIATKAGLDADGNILDWQLDLWSMGHSTRPGSDPGGLIAGWYVDPPFERRLPGGPGGATRNGQAIYNFPGHLAVSHYTREMPVRVSATRGLGAYFNVFSIESFMDECALAAGADPIEYRLRYIDEPRYVDVITAAADAFGWASFEKANSNRGRGIGFARYKNTDTICAVIVELEVNQRNGRISLIRAVAAADAGHLVHPDNVANQIQGGAIQAFSWTLKEEVRFSNTGITSEDWASYPILTHAEIPPIEVVLVNRPGEWFMGSGEASQGPAGVAVANAVADATGVRFRRIPLTPSRILDGLEAAAG